MYIFEEATIIQTIRLLNFVYVLEVYPFYILINKLFISFLKFFSIYLKSLMSSYIDK